MNKKNTKKYNKRILKNNIVMLPNDFTVIKFVNGEHYMCSSGKPFLVGKQMTIGNPRRGIYGTINSYISARVISVKRIKGKSEKRWLMKIEPVAYIV